MLLGEIYKALKFVFMVLQAVPLQTKGADT